MLYSKSEPLRALGQVSHPSKVVRALLRDVVMQPVDAVFDAILGEPFPIYCADTCRSCAHCQGLSFQFPGGERDCPIFVSPFCSVHEITGAMPHLPRQCRQPRLSRKF